MKYMKKRKAKRTKRRMIVISVLLVLVAFIYILFNIDGAARVSNLTSLVFSPIIKTFNNSVNWVSDSFSAFSTNQKIISENEDLKMRVSELESKLILIDEYSDEIKDYKELLGLQKELVDFEIITAKIVFSTVGNIQSGFTLNKGVSRGVDKGMPVLFGDKLFGIVKASDLISSRVRTIFDKDFALFAINADNHEVMRIRGDSLAYHSDLMVCDYLPSRSEIKVGDRIETSSLGDVYPNSIKIGVVESIEYDRDSIPVKAYIRPYIELNDIDVVNVLSYKGIEGDVSNE